jgi:predicted histone-like DNA-binding protein
MLTTANIGFNGSMGNAMQPNVTSRKFETERENANGTKNASGTFTRFILATRFMKWKKIGDADVTHDVNFTDGNVPVFYRMHIYTTEEASAMTPAQTADALNTLGANKVIEEAAKRSGISEGVIKAAWDAAGEVIRTWATEGHNVPLPGLGSMRFGVRSKSVKSVEDVKTSLITARRVIFIPSKEVKDELQSTKIAITCYDKDGNIVKRVTSADTDDVEDGEDDGNTGNSGSQSQNGGNTNQGGNTSQGGDEGGDEPFDGGN